MGKNSRPSFSRNVISSPDQIPSLSSVSLALIHSVLDESIDINEIIQTIRLDPTLSSRILKVSNSALFGMRQPVATLSRAVPLLGRKILKNIILTSVIFDTFKMSKADGFKAFWKHAIGCGLACEWFCSQDNDMPEPEEGFLGGLLHDLGKLIIYSNFPPMIEDLLERLADQSFIEQRNRPPIMVENEIWHVDHTIVGKWATEKWKFPETLTECVWLHHQPFPLDEPRKSLPPLIRFVDAMCNVYAIGENYFLNSAHKLGCHIHYTNTFNMVRDLWGIDETDIRDLLAYIYTKMGEYTQLLEIESESEEAFISTLCKANFALGQMHLKAEAEQTRLLALNAYIKSATRFINQCASEPYFKTLAEATWKFISPHATIQELILFINPASKGRLYLYKLTRDGLFERILNPEIDGLKPDDVINIVSGSHELKEGLQSAISEKRVVFKKPGSHTDKGTFPFLWAVPLFLSDPEGGKKAVGGIVCKALMSRETRMDESNLTLYLENFSGILSPLVSFILSIENVSEREEKLSALSNKMGISEERMIHQQRLALIGQLATGAAHEINNPLAVISVKAQMLEKKVAEEDRERFIKVILDQTDRIAKITTDLMNFARPTKPKQESVSLRDILDQVESVISARISLRDIHFKDKVAKELPNIYVDAKQIEQVLINLVINARHAVEEGGKIEIDAEEKRNFVVLSVSDNGTGIKKENLPRIFDPFFTTKTEGKGTGLGLPISQRIVEINGGKITVESEEGKGTTFRVWLPIDQSPVLSELAHAYPARKTEKAKRVRRILIVEDERFLREVLKENLTQEDIHVDAAEDGLAAIDYLKKNTYDIAILDLVMPRMNGVELIGWLRKNVPSLPIVVISAVASEEEAKKLFKLGVKKFMKKPFKIEEILKVVDELTLTDSPS